jgi:hypothetical protein
MVTPFKLELQGSITPSLALFASISVPEKREQAPPRVESVLTPAWPAEIPGNIPGWHAAPAGETCRTLSCALTRAVPHGSFL